MATKARALALLVVIAAAYVVADVGKWRCMAEETMEEKMESAAENMEQSVEDAAKSAKDTAGSWTDWALDDKHEKMNDQKLSTSDKLSSEKRPGDTMSFQAAEDVYDRTVKKVGEAYNSFSSSGSGKERYEKAKEETSKATGELGYMR